MIFLDGDADVHEAESEIFSETSTVVSRKTGRSMVSARSRRTKRVEKKKQSLKKGSRYEDIALMNVIKEILMQIHSSNGELEFY